MQLSEGVHESRDGEILELILVTETHRTSLFSPTEFEMEDECRKHGISWFEIDEIVTKYSQQGAHTVLIDVPVYLAAQKKEQEAADEIEGAPEASP